MRRKWYGVCKRNIEKKCMDCSCNKYQGYFYKIGGNKR